MTPDFVVTIDTEADNEWSLGGSRSYANVQALPRFQDLCERYGIVPTYLVTSDVAEDGAARETLQALNRGGGCEIGAHLHAWTTPPDHELMPGMFRHHPYLHEYPPEIQARKLEHLTRTLTKAFGQPHSYRGGRWSFDDEAARLLVSNGYVVDTTITPGLSWRLNPGYSPSSCGPDFSGEPLQPYRLLVEAGELVEAPVSIIARGRLQGLAQSRLLSSGPLGSLGRRGLHKLGLCRMTWLRPGFSSGAQMQEVCEELCRQEAPLLNLMFHSSELIPGGSPRIKDQAAADEFWASLEQVFQHVGQRLRLRSLGLTHWARQWQEQTVAQRNPAGPAKRLSRGVPSYA